MSRIDRIAEPWGTRTPYGPGETWPTRVDSYLADGLTEEDVDRWVQSASILHSNGDGLDIAVKDGRIVGVRGRAVDRVNHGRLGPKDLFGWQANHSPDRLTRRWSGATASWSRPTGTPRWTPSSAAPRSCSTSRAPARSASTRPASCSSRSTTRSALIAHGGIGTNHVDGNTRLCTATAAAALKESFGCDGQPGSYTDVDHADVIALYGHNVAETQTVLWTRILDRLAGAEPAGARLRRPAADPGGAGGDRAPGAAAGHERDADERAAARDHRATAGSTRTTSRPTRSASTSSRSRWRTTRRRSPPRSATSPRSRSARRPG